jgi:dephospho-CoA kinase
MRVVGICGTNGSGKGLVSEILKKLIGSIPVSAREMILSLAKEEGFEINNRDDTKAYNDKRHKEGKSLGKDFIRMYNVPENKDKVITFESIRRPKEIELFRKVLGKDFILVSVDAPIETRYSRVTDRKSVTDLVDFEKFKEQEIAESIGTLDYEMNIVKCMGLADVKLVNDGSMEEFEQIIKAKLLPVI